MSRSGRERALDALPQAGFVRVARKGISSQQRTALIRKGNELFAKDEIQLARTIFVATHYSDGLRRLGFHYETRGELLEALRMYWLAPDTSKLEPLVERCAGVLRKWLGDAAE